MRLLLVLLLAGWVGCSGCSAPQADTAPEGSTQTASPSSRSDAPGGNAPSDAEARYTTVRASRDGTGKVYMGREIAHVMGHRGAAWLERPEREREEQPDALVAALDLEPTDTVVDLGAGTGYFTFRLAELVPEGEVLAVDIQPEMLTMLGEQAQALGVDNVARIQGTETDPNLPAGSADLVLLVDAYHEFSYPYETMRAVARALKPGGRVALVEYRAEDPSIPIKRLHKMSAAQARKEMAAVGLDFVENLSLLPTQHLLIFEKP